MAKAVYVLLSGKRKTALRGCFSEKICTITILLALLSDFRAFDLIKEYKYPSVIHDQMKGLLAKYEDI